MFDMLEEGDDDALELVSEEVSELDLLETSDSEQSWPSSMGEDGLWVPLDRRLISRIVFCGGILANMSSSSCNKYRGLSEPSSTGSAYSCKVRGRLIAPEGSYPFAVLFT